MHTVRNEATKSLHRGATDSMGLMACTAQPAVAAATTMKQAQTSRKAWTV